MRKRVNPRKDRKIFKKTASKTKAVNLGYSMMRGGIRF